MRSYRDIERRLGALEAQAFPDFARMTDTELEDWIAQAAALSPAEDAAIRRMTDAELESLAVMSEREALAFVARKIQEGKG